MSIGRRWTWCGLGLMAMLLAVAGAAGVTAEEPKGDAKSLQGSWTMLSYIDEGAADPQFDQATQVFEGASYRVEKGGKSIRKGDFKLDATKSPKQIDLMPSIGPYKGKTLPGIYQRDGDSLHTCFPEPGQPRPTKFTSEKGSGCSEVKYKRTGK
jgi:uncharacterized protein (TIGR03067 family)